jgi:ABC-type antimicrobial peptide transport system permease subunit
MTLPEAEDSGMIAATIFLALAIIIAVVAAHRTKGGGMFAGLDTLPHVIAVLVLLLAAIISAAVSLIARWWP